MRQYHGQRQTATDGPAVDDLDDDVVALLAWFARGRWLCVTVRSNDPLAIAADDPFAWPIRRLIEIGYRFRIVPIELDEPDRAFIRLHRTDRGRSR